MRPADYAIYKGKAALRFTLKPGEPMPITSPERGTSYTATKPGVIFVQVAKTIGERRYDWENKITLGITATEAAKVILAMQGRGGEFFHDPNMGTDLQGRESKRLTFSTPMDNGTIFCNLEVTRNGATDKLPSVPISPDEAVVLEELCKVAIPKILGWA